VKERIILDLCAGTGAWSQPYVEAGYDVRRLTLPHGDVTTYEPPPGVWGVLAAPPCTEFASSGARWWNGKPPGLLREALRVIIACLRIIALAKPEWWAVENPIGRLNRYLGPPVMYFDPCDYGDPYTKRTALWGRFNNPKTSRVEPVEKSPIHWMPPGPERAAKRSITPPGFARAFFEANP
jgi:hypothetical protein